MCSTYTYTCTIIQVGKRTIHIITQAHVVHINRCHAYSCVDYTFFQSVLITPHTLRQAVSSGKDPTKKCIPQMARELEHLQAPAIRNNIVVVLSNLTVRYCIKVDPYIPDMAACLKDESLLVRR